MDLCYATSIIFFFEFFSGKKSKQFSKAKIFNSVYIFKFKFSG